MILDGKIVVEIVNKVILLCSCFNIFEKVINFVIVNVGVFLNNRKLLVIVLDGFLKVYFLVMELIYFIVMFLDYVV